MSVSALPRRLPLALVVALAGLGWAASAMRMQGMDPGPTVSLGTFGWFAVTWVVMMAAMMLPAIAPVATSASRGARPALGGQVFMTGAFLVGYLGLWSLVGAAVFGLLRAGDAITGQAFVWAQGGRWLAVGVLILATVYQLTAVKRASLERCRARLNPPSGAGPWRVHEGVDAGLRAGARCLACSWALMLALFALGAMSLLWMGVVTALIAAERLLPASRPARIGAAAVLAALAVGVAVAPASVPGLTVPGTGSSMSAMSSMR